MYVRSLIKYVLPDIAAGRKNNIIAEHKNKTEYKMFFLDMAVLAKNILLFMLVIRVKMIRLDSM